MSADGARVLPEAAEAQLAQLAQLIAQAPLNLVSRGERERVRSGHVDEAVAVDPLLRIAPGAHWLDLGTGGGLPGLVLAILHPDAAFTLLDARRKKILAVEEFSAELGLTNVRTCSGRAERLAREPDHRAAYDGVVSRAVAGLATVLELSRGFLRDGGVMAAIKGPRAEEELEAARPALSGLRLTGAALRVVPSVERPTVLVTMTASGPVPNAVPRADGVPLQAPLGHRVPRRGERST